MALDRDLEQDHGEDDRKDEHQQRLDPLLGLRQGPRGNVEASKGLGRPGGLGIFKRGGPHEHVFLSRFTT